MVSPSKCDFLKWKLLDIPHPFDEVVDMML